MHSGFLGTIIGLIVFMAVFYLLLNNASNAQRLGKGFVGAYGKVAATAEGK